MKKVCSVCGSPIYKGVKAFRAPSGKWKHQNEVLCKTYKLIHTVSSEKDIAAELLRTSRPVWEYYSMRIAVYQVTDALNEAGSHGWECFYCDQQHDFFVLLLKRVKE